MNEIPALRIERAVLREIHEDGTRQPYSIKTAAGVAPGARGYNGMLVRMERRGLCAWHLVDHEWRLTEAGFAAIREDAS